jgi:hypothetical protein
VDLKTFSQTTEILEKAIKRTRIENQERIAAMKRLRSAINYGQK